MANTTIKQHVPIFVSSTYEDMIPYREEVQRVLNRLEQIIKGMEYFGSTPQKPLETCLSELGECRLFIGIIGMKYGSVNEEENKSFTQIEYEAAIKGNIPTLIYIIDENHPIPSKFVETGAGAKRLQEFKAILKTKHTVSSFTTPQDLGTKLSNDLLIALSKLDQIHIEKNLVANNSCDDVFQTLNNFGLRPAKYHGYECILTMQIEKKGNMLRESIARVLGLTIGDSVIFTVSILDRLNQKVKIQNNEKISLFAQAEELDWIEKFPEGSIIKAKVRFSFAVIQEIKSHDKGVLLEVDSFKQLILVEGIESSNE